MLFSFSLHKKELQFVVWSGAFAWWLLLLYSVVFVPMKAHIWLVLSLPGADGTFLYNDTPGVYFGATWHLGRNFSILKIFLTSQFT